MSLVTTPGVLTWVLKFFFGFSKVVVGSDGWVGRLPMQRRQRRMPEKHLNLEFCDLAMFEREREIERERETVWKGGKRQRNYKGLVWYNIEGRVIRGVILPI